jgi:hypothetical protein
MKQLKELRKKQIELAERLDKCAIQEFWSLAIQLTELGKQIKQAREKE